MKGKKELVVEEMKAGLHGQVIKNLNQDKIKLVKNSKGYGWEISVFFEEEKEGVEKLDRLNRLLIKLWGTTESPEKED